VGLSVDALRLWPLKIVWFPSHAPACSLYASSGEKKEDMILPCLTEDKRNNRSHPPCAG
jgi:hypothetical protein